MAEPQQPTDGNFPLWAHYENQRLDDKEKAFAATFFTILFLAIALIFALERPDLANTFAAIFPFSCISIVLLFTTWVFGRNTAIATHRRDTYVNDMRNHRKRLLEVLALEENNVRRGASYPYLDTKAIDEKKEWIRTRALDPYYHPTEQDTFIEEDVRTFMHRLVDTSRA